MFLYIDYIFTIENKTSTTAKLLAEIDKNLSMNNYELHKIYYALGKIC